MQKVLFIVHEYYPVGSAITNCLNPIINKMKELNIEVNILTRKYPLNLKDFEIIDNVKVYRVEDTYLELLNKRDAVNKKTLKYLYYKIKFHLLWKKMNKSVEDGYYNKKQMIKKGKKIVKEIDTIISCSYPFTSHKIAYEIKGNKKWIPYQFDPYTYNYTFPKNKKDERLKIELEYLSKASAIFITEESYLENIKTELVELKNKYIILPYGLIKKPINQITSNKNEYINFTFAGTLYTDLREPYKMLDILLSLNLKKEINIYYVGDEKINNNLKKYQNRINLYPRSLKQICDKAQAEANIILNIGNTTLNQTPSKVFELISLGKPILNFYEKEEDTSKNILKNYELVYNINVNDYKIEEILDFINKNKYKILPFEEATKNYLKSNEVANKFIEEVDKIENR